MKLYANYSRHAKVHSCATKCGYTSLANILNLRRARTQAPIFASRVLNILTLGQTEKFLRK